MTKKSKPFDETGVCKVSAQKIQEHIHLLRASDRLRVRIAEGTENTENTEKEGFAKITL